MLLNKNLWVYAQVGGRLSICHSERRRSRSEESIASLLDQAASKRLYLYAMPIGYQEIPRLRLGMTEAFFGVRPCPHRAAWAGPARTAPHRSDTRGKSAPLSFPSHLPPGQHKSPGQFGPGLFLQCWRRLFVVLVLAVADDHQLVVELLIHVFDDVGQLIVPHHGVAALGVQGVHPVLDRGNDVRALAHHFFIL